MTEHEMMIQIETSANAIRHTGGNVEINHNIPYVAVTFSYGDEYFFQGSEAEDLLAEVPDYVSAEDYILWSSVNW